MGLFSRKPREFDRRAAWSCKPVRLPIIRKQEVEHGKLRITVNVVPPKWTHWIGSREKIERTFGLDPLGRSVYEACDGQTPVKAIIRDFAKANKIGAAEAEMSVSTFLKTLTAKGLIAMAWNGKKNHE